MGTISLTKHHGLGNDFLVIFHAPVPEEDHTKRVSGPVVSATRLPAATSGAPATQSTSTSMQAPTLAQLVPVIGTELTA